MEPTMRDFKREMQESLAQLRTLRDEIRVRLHLAGMDAKDAWKKMEPALDEADRLAGEATEASRVAIDKLVKGVKAFGASLSEHETTKH